MIKSNSVFNPAALPKEYMSGYEKQCTTAAENKSYFLYPGQLYISRHGVTISTILGSCAALCLWDAVKKIGGMNHYLLPEGREDAVNPYRYGNNANAALLKQLLALGCDTKDLQGKVFGGSSSFSAAPENSLGAQNVKLAEAFLKEHRIPLLLMDVNGKRGRRLTFHTADGTTHLKVFDKP